MRIRAQPGSRDYLDRASIGLVLRPLAFRANAIDVEGLYRFAVATAKRYREIKAPTVIVSGDRDTVVAEEIHSKGMARAIAGSELVWIGNLGHKRTGSHRSRGGRDREGRRGAA